MSVFDRELRKSDLARALAEEVHPLSGAPADFDPLLEAVGDKRIVLLGEATHGSHEFYRARAQITRRLIQEKGFTAVAVEADWPDAYRVNRYLHGRGTDLSAAESLGNFRQFPAWMWRNADVLDLVGWLRTFNEETLDRGARMAGFYGLDLYSLHASMASVLSYLDETDPQAAALARERYACFDAFGEPEDYGRDASSGLGSCEDEVVAQLVDLQRRRAEFIGRDGILTEDAFFHAEQSARVVRNAEQYYRTMFEGGAGSWNLRDTHMADTLDALLAHLGRTRTDCKVVVWAHNSHLGDARATEASWNQGELNLGQLVRERHGGEVLSAGFTTHHGTVSAASDWGGAAERKTVRPSMEGSYEAVFHAVGVPRFMLPLGDLGEASGALREERLERAIGVVYRPRTERWSHYFRARLPEQFDFLLHFDETRALEPLERSVEWEAGEAPETFPSGM